MVNDKASLGAKVKLDIEIGGTWYEGIEAEINGDRDDLFPTGRVAIRVVTSPPASLKVGENYEFRVRDVDGSVLYKSSHDGAAQVTERTGEVWELQFTPH